MARRWTRTEEQALLQGIGVYGIAWLRMHCGSAYIWANAIPGRSASAVSMKAARLFGQGGLTRGTYTINRIIRESGYSLSQIKRAMRALAQKWKRLSFNGAYLIHEDQYEDIVQWLATDYWSKQHRLYNCLWCHEHKLGHKGKGLCRRCYCRYIKQLERYQLPTSNKLLLDLVRSQITDSDVRKKIERQLSRGRALPEKVVNQLNVFAGGV